MIRGQDETAGRIERERVVRLATIGGRGRAHVAPGVFAPDGEVFCSPTDAGQGRSRPDGCGGTGCAARPARVPSARMRSACWEREYQQFTAAAPR